MKDPADDFIPDFRPPDAPEPAPVTMPCPPGLDPVKWATLDRKTRRELWRHHRKLSK